MMQRFKAYPVCHPASGPCGDASPERSGRRLAALRSLASFACLAMLLSGCASHTQPDMDDSAAGSDDGQQGREASATRRGGPSGGGLWTEMARTALQTGMGFIHH